MRKETQNGNGQPWQRFSINMFNKIHENYLMTVKIYYLAMSPSK